MEIKQQFRKKIKLKLKKIDIKSIEKKSKIIFLELKKYIKKYQIRFVFLSKKNEFQTQELINFLGNKGKKILIPYIDQNNNMKIVIYKKNMSLKIGKYGILEVKDPIFFHGKIDIAIIPGLAFTKNGDRLGKGGGFYDKFLNKNKKIYKIGVCFTEQIVKKLPIENHDISVDKIIYA